MKYVFRILYLVSCLVAASLPATAHEFWISPVNYAIQPDEQAQAHLRVGQGFIGPAYSYQTRQFERFEVLQNGNVIPVTGRLGDVPAMTMDGLGDGLAIIVHETTDSTLTYSEWPKFEKFIDHKAMTGTRAAHTARGIRQENFKEAYRRFAKSLVAVGSGAGMDFDTGMQTEIIALNNPYTETLTEMSVKVMLDGAPRKNAQIELFIRDTSGEIDVQLHKTNEDGIGTFPVRPGHEYLVDAVAMEQLPNDDPDAGPVWRSLWAALTFKLPN